MMHRIIDKSAPSDASALSAALSGLSWHQQERGEFAMAIDHATRAVQLCLQINDNALLGRCYVIIAGAHLAQGRVKLAQEFLLRSLLRAAGPQRDDRVCTFHTMRARLHWFVGEYNLAREELDRALAEATGENEAIVNLDCARMSLLANAPEKAREHLAKAEAVAARLQMVAMKPQLLALKAACLQFDGAFDKVQKLLDQAQALADAARDRRVTCSIRFARAKCLDAAGQHEAAIGELRAAQANAEAIGYRLLLTLILGNLSDMLSAAGNLVEAERALRQSRKLQVW